MDDAMEDFRKAYLERIDFIDRNKERLIEAWVAETGYLPSESVLVIKDEAFVTKIWVEKKPKEDVTLIETAWAKLPYEPFKDVVWLGKDENEK